MKTRTTILNILCISLLLLWIPVSLDKLINWNSYAQAIARQPLTADLQWIARYCLPGLEIMTALLLTWPSCRRWGLLLSSILMAIFTTYIGLALLGTWERLPCGCGSVIAGLSWSQHFWFNLFFLGVSVLGLLIRELKSDRVMSERVMSEGVTE